MTFIATYRLQLHAKFTFDDAIAIADYLKDLGVSHVYCSPYLQATAGSTHGYDVVDHRRVSDEIGGSGAHKRFQLKLGSVGLGQVLDVVPNHMAIGTRANSWWWDVLENGPASRFASFFDVEWHPPESKLENMVLVPILGDHYGRVLESGHIRLAREGGKFTVNYYDNVLPAAPESTSRILAAAAASLGSDELAFLADSLRSLPRPTTTSDQRLERRNRDKEIIAAHLARLLDADRGLAAAIDAGLAAVNADPDALDDILGQQNYRLAFWRTAGRELGYRRFFDINTLVGLRAEDPVVFDATHSLVLEWLRKGVLDGIRIDHPDGLRDPKAYFERLHEAAPDAWIVAEKILEPGEQLRLDWKVAGTTGYDFMDRVSRLFVDPAGEEILTSLYASFSGDMPAYNDLVRERKHQLLRGTLGSDVNRLTALFMDICERHRRFRDFTRHETHQALREVIACFPVYRTYVRAESGEVAPEDRRYIDNAVSSAKNRRVDLSSDLFDFIRSVLLLEVTGAPETEFVMRFQQFTGPAMAKGLEDTVFYVYNRLVSLNEVGGDPGHFSYSLEEFHRSCEETQEHWPLAMLATSTHDTKRSEDVRLRIHLLSEMPEEWSEIARRWSARNQRHRTGDLPDSNLEYLYYQTLLGAWPIDLDRIKNYIEKAAREAKTYTSWTDPDARYEEALTRFVTESMNDVEFMQDVAEVVQPLIMPSRVHSLAQLLIKLTSPGIPDIYQGAEIWDLSLVDPDNRRPVDYQRRRALLQEVISGSLQPEEVWSRSDEGLPKIWITRLALALRARYPEAFGPGATYQRVTTEGPKADHLIAFGRSGRIITVVPRLTLKLNRDWRDTRVILPGGVWRNAFTNEDVQRSIGATELYRRFPVALLYHVDDRQ